MDKSSCSKAAYMRFASIIHRALKSMASLQTFDGARHTGPESFSIIGRSDDVIPSTGALVENGAIEKAKGRSCSPTSFCVPSWGKDK